MAAVQPRSLIGKLNATCRRALEGAAGLCMSRTHYAVEVEHWLLKLLEQSDIDLPPILKYYGTSVDRVRSDLERTLGRMRTGSSGAPALTPGILDVVREAWTLASLEYGAYSVRSGHLLVALATDSTLSLKLQSMSPELAKIPAEKLQKEFLNLVGKSVENEEEAAAASSASASSAATQQGGQGPRPGSKTPSLD